MKENKPSCQCVRRPLKFKDGSTLEDRVAKILSEILSDKYDCKVTIRFVDAPAESATVRSHDEEAVI